MGAFTELLIIAVLIVINGAFVAAEIALVTVRRSRLQQLIDEGSKGARRVDRLISQPSRFLAVVQLAITFIGFLAAAFAGASIAQSLEPLLGALGSLAGASRDHHRDPAAGLPDRGLRRAHPQDPRPGPPGALRDAVRATGGHPGSGAGARWSRCSTASPAG